MDNIPERQVSEEDIQDFTKRTGLSVFEASAKTGNGVESSFIAITEALAQIQQKKRESTQGQTSSETGSVNGGQE